MHAQNYRYHTICILWLILALLVPSLSFAAYPSVAVNQSLSLEEAVKAATRQQINQTRETQVFASRINHVGTWSFGTSTIIGDMISSGTITNNAGIPVPADYDGDGKADLSVKTDDGHWRIDYARNGFGSWEASYAEYGGPGALPVPADYDGDGKADLSVKLDDGHWLINYANNGFGPWDASYAEYGGPGAVPVPADYDGDGKADLSVKLDDGHWLINYANNGFGPWDASYPEYGGPGALPVPADYDGDGKADLSVKLDDGHWLINYANNGFGPWDASYAEYGGPGAVPVPADYDGDGKADLSVKLDDGHWLINYAHNGFGAWDASYAEYGGSGAIPVPADYDGDGKADLSVKLDNAEWLIDYAHNGFGSWDVVVSYDGKNPTPPPTQPINTILLPVRYVDQVFVQQKLNSSKRWNYCGPASTAMLLHYYGVEKRDVFTDRAPTLELAEEFGILYGGGSKRDSLKNAFFIRGLNTEFRILPEHELKQVLRDGHPVIFSSINWDHIFVIVGFRENGNFLVHDPFAGRYAGINGWSPTAQRNDVPWASAYNTPQTKGASQNGQFVEYSYAELQNTNIFYMLRVTGKAPPFKAVTSQVNTANGTFKNEGLEIAFNPQAHIEPASSTISLIHTPQFAPSSSTTSNMYQTSIASFKLQAKDSSGAELKQTDNQFSMKIDIDPLLIKEWGKGQGSAAGRDAPTSSQNGAVMPIRQALVIAKWNEQTKSWLELATTLDIANAQVTTNSQQLGEYAVFIRHNSGIVYLPSVKK